MKVTLQLRYSPTPLREAAARFIPGASPRAWLAEMASWSVPLASAKLHVVPGESSTAAAGILVELPGNVKPAHTTTALPYGQITMRLFVPVEAELDPPLSEKELTALVSAGSDTFVWHPAHGLVRFADDAVLTVAQLLSSPPASNRHWDAALPGIATNQRLLSIEPSERPSFEDVMQSGRGDIGSRPMKDGGLPQAPGEPAGGAIGRAVASAGLSAAAGAADLLASAAQAVSAGLSNIMGGASPASGTASAGASQQPRQNKAGSGGPNWLERLADWARQRQQAMQQNLEQLRNNQIERLLHSLQNSPDLGLRFALPLTGGGAPRGLAPPSAFLTERNVNFNLGRLGGGRAADYWDLSEDYRRKLAQRYRELANREIGLGRHRRAAYILAELLGDLSSAAATLANGGHFREAALLYEERLKQPLAAARCLQRGGLLTEAVALFERLGEYEIAGDLYRQLDQPEPAERAYRQAVSRLLAAHDHLGAARLVENKLQLPDDALIVLINGWHGSSQSERCLDEAFALLARHHKDERAEQLVGEISETLPGKPVLLAGALSRVVTAYPNDSVRSAARTATRVLVSQNLPAANGSDSDSLLRALKMTVPADRLLERDCTRYQDRRAEEERRRLAALATPARPARGNLPRPVSWFRLPQGNWKAAVSVGDEFYAAGFHQNWLLAVRGRWDGSVQIPLADPAVVPAEVTDAPIFLAADPRGLAWTYLHVAPHYPQRDLQFMACDKFQRAMRVCPVWGSEHPLEGLTYGMGHSLLLLTLPEPGIAQVVPYDVSLRVQGLRTLTYSVAALDEDEIDEIVRPLPFFAREQTLYLAVGPRLYSKSTQQVAARFSSSILSITGSAPHARARIILACEQGGYVLWGDSAESPATRFAQDLARPVVGLTRGGLLVAAAQGVVEVFSTHDGRLAYVGQTSAHGAEPLAILPTSDASRFALLSSDGMVTIYEAPIS